MTDEEWNKHVEREARRIKLGKLTKVATTKYEKDKQLQSLKELKKWLDNYDPLLYCDYKLQVKAEIDRHISKYFSSIGVNHAKLGR